MQTINSYYRTLGLDISAKKEDIKKAYSTLVRKYHPDTAAVPNRFLLERVIEAYRMLKNADLKKIRPRTTLKDIFRQQPQPVREQTIEEKLRKISVHVKSGKKASYFYLRQGLYDKNEQVVCASIRAIGTLRILQSAPEFSALFMNGNEKIKLNILDAVDRMEKYRVFNDLIMSAVTDRSAGVRKKAWKMHFKALGKRIIV